MTVLAGCTPATVKKAQIAEVVGCVPSLQDIAPARLAYLPAGADAPEHVQFATLARCVHPDGGVATPVALYRLEGVTPPAQVDVSVLLSTGGTLPAAVELLDTGLKPVRRYGFEHFVRRGQEYTLTAFLNTSLQHVAYVAVMPDRSQAGKSDVAIGSAAAPIPIVAGPVLFTYHAGNETNTVRPFVEGGQIRVAVAPQQHESLTPPVN